VLQSKPCLQDIGEPTEVVMRSFRKSGYEIVDRYVSIIDAGLIKLSDLEIYVKLH
jgi:hypothetical protein